MAGKIGITIGAIVLALAITGMTCFIIRRRRRPRRKLQEDPHDPDNLLISGRLGIKEDAIKDETVELDTLSQMPRIRYPPEDIDDKLGGRTRFDN